MIFFKTMSVIFHVIRAKCNEYDDGFNEWRTKIEQGKFQAIMFIYLIYNLHESIMVWCLTPLAFPFKGFV